MCVDSEEVIRAMWKKLHRDDPDLVGAFEDFLGRTAGEIKRSRGEFDTLEAALKRCLYILQLLYNHTAVLREYFYARLDVQYIIP